MVRWVLQVRRRCCVVQLRSPSDHAGSVHRSHAVPLWQAREDVHGKRLYRMYRTPATTHERPQEGDSVMAGCEVMAFPGSPELSALFDLC